MEYNDYNKQYMAGRIEGIQSATSLQLERAYRKVIGTFSRGEAKAQGQIEAIAITTFLIFCFAGGVYWFVKNEENKATMNPDGNDPIPTLSSPPTGVAIPTFEPPIPLDVPPENTPPDLNSWSVLPNTCRRLNYFERIPGETVVSLTDYTIELRKLFGPNLDLEKLYLEYRYFNGDGILDSTVRTAFDDPSNMFTTKSRDVVCMLVPPSQMPAELRKIVQLPSDRYEFIKPNITHHVYKSRVNHFPPISPIII